MVDFSNKRLVIPRRKINVEGSINYSESFQAWNIIKIKKELFSEFPELKEKRSKFSYQLMFCRSYDEFLKMAKKLKNQEVMPLLMWIYKEQ